MPATQEQINKALGPDSPWDDGVKRLILWQFGMHTSGFQIALWDLIKVADLNNLRLLSYGFPSEVEAFLDWTQGDLGTRLREWGLGI